MAMVMTPEQEIRMRLMKAVAKSLSDQGAVLKGGTALLMAYGLDRFSEDVDFDLPLIEKTDLQQLLEKSITQAGMTVKNIHCKKNTDVTSRYTLHTEELESLLKVDIFHRRDVLNEDEIELHDGIRVYSVAALTRMKTDAFCHRMVGRDIYDITFLTGQYPEKITPEMWSRIEERVEEQTLEGLAEGFDREVKKDKLLNIDGTTCALSLNKNIEQNKQIQHSLELEKLRQDTRLIDHSRAIDNSSYKGYETTKAENDTLDILEQAKTALKEHDMAKDTEIVRGQPGMLVKDATVTKRTENYIALMSGRKNYVYELKKLEVRPPAQAMEGDKINLSWAEGEQKATLRKAEERKQEQKQGRSRGLEPGL